MQLGAFRAIDAGNSGRVGTSCRFAHHPVEPDPKMHHDLATAGIRMTDLETIRRDIEQHAFHQAYLTISIGLENDPAREDLLNASRLLSAAVRSRCMDLASSKATEMSQELNQLEVLLGLTIRLNGEGPFG